MSATMYTRHFYERLRNGATQSAEVIVPMVLKLLSVRSVVDVGCGDGSWLAVFRKLGVSDTLGIDGSYVERNVLQIPSECFRALDLAKPFHLERTFDLALSLEVAEHLPPESGADFVNSLTSAAPVVMFSAAIPHQGGDNHINEQWPDKWAALFQQHAYVPVDSIRPRVWKNNAVDWWYAQNTLLFVRQDLVERSSTLREEFQRTNPDQLSLVHPKKYLEVAGPVQPPVNGVIAASRLLLTCLRNSVKTRLAPAQKKGILP